MNEAVAQLLIFSSVVLGMLIGVWLYAERRFRRLEQEREQIKRMFHSYR